MKKIFLIFLIAFVACSKKSTNPSENIKDKTDIEISLDTLNDFEVVDSLDLNGLGKEYTSKYICPMHCVGSGSDKPGKCPVCGAEYIENPDYSEKSN